MRAIYSANWLPSIHLLLLSPLLFHNRLPETLSGLLCGQLPSEGLAPVGHSSDLMRRGIDHWYPAVSERAKILGIILSTDQRATSSAGTPRPLLIPCHISLSIIFSPQPTGAAFRDLEKNHSAPGTEKNYLLALMSTEFSFLRIMSARPPHSARCVYVRQARSRRGGERQLSWAGVLAASVSVSVVSAVAIFIYHSRLRKEAFQALICRRGDGHTEWWECK